MVPLGPLTPQLGLLTRRELLQQITTTIQPRQGAEAAMYVSIFAAFREMTALFSQAMSTP